MTGLSDSRGSAPDVCTKKPLQVSCVIPFEDYYLNVLMSTLLMTTIGLKGKKQSY